MRGRAGVGKGDNQALCWGNRKLSQGTSSLAEVLSRSVAWSDLMLLLLPAPDPGLRPFPVPLALLSLTGCLGVRVEAWGYYGPRVELHRC